MGAAWYLPEERQITTTEQLLDEMCSALGGRAAEQLIFGEISTGALSDLEKVTKQAYAMVSIYGLSPQLGNISYYDSQGQTGFTKPYSEDRAKLIDTEVSRIIEEQYNRALKLLTDNKDKLTQLAEKLLVHEVIFKDDLEEIFGKRIWDKEEAMSSVKSDSNNDKELDLKASLNKSSDENGSAESTDRLKVDPVSFGSTTSLNENSPSTTDTSESDMEKSESKDEKPQENGE